MKSKLLFYISAFLVLANSIACAIYLLYNYVMLFIFPFLEYKISFITCFIFGIIIVGFFSDFD